MKMRVARYLLGTAAAAMAIVGFMPVGSASAQSDYSGAVYQVEFSLNCNNPTAPCQHMFGLGGVWGWIALMPDGTTNAQVTDCGHTLGGGAVGAHHFSFDSHWITFSSPSAPTPISPTDPNGRYLGIETPPEVGLPPVPATYGHYHISFQGASGEITIAP